MRAIVRTQYGPLDVLHLEQVEKPVPQDHQVLIRVHAASANPADLHVIGGEPFPVRFADGGLLKPRKTIPGTDAAGQVEAVGAGVERFRPGDEVFGDLSACGWGAFAEYVCARDDALALKPAGTTFEAAAAVPLAGVTALQALRKGQIQSGQRVLIYGAGGGVGTFAVQIAKSFGAEVTAVCGAQNVDVVRSIGADQVLDYTREDFARSPRRYDLILAVNGHRPISDYRRALNSGGVHVASGGSMAQVFQAMLLGPWLSMTGSKKMGSLMATPNSNDLAFVANLIEAGKVTPVIDRGYPLSEAAEALRYVEAGHTRGKVVISIVS